MQNIWYKNAVIYCVDVETFQDSNGDGVGDFRGLKDRLDYIAGLGATCIWLLPFFATPNRDNGYDVSDYYAVDPRLGTLGDFVEFTHLAKERGLRVIVDLVVNHTSDRHPWFEAAASDRHSPWRDWYLWSDEQPEDHAEGMVFPGHQKTTWTWDDRAGAYYFHRFYEFEPDLNIANPAVREEIERIMGFWLQLGVSGFRVDAVPFVIETRPREGEWVRHYDYLGELRAFMSWRRGDAVMLAEANVTPDEVADYVGDGDRMNMMFNFTVNQRLFLALARGDARPLREALRSLPPLPDRCQWGSFLRNHDELDLGRLEEAEREECFAHFAPDPDMRLYGRGIRRRLAPMLGNDRRRLELAYSLMFSLPGSPVLWYGEEIGMGDDLSLPERSAVRTPMQWSDEAQGGFTTAREPVRPVIADGPFGYDRVNVAAQQRDRRSLLSWMQAATRVRRGLPELGWGGCELLETGEDTVLAHRARWRGRTSVILHNLGPDPREVTLPGLTEGGDHLQDLFSDGDYADPVRGDGPVRLSGYGYRWLQLAAG